MNRYIDIKFDMRGNMELRLTLAGYLKAVKMVVDHGGEEIRDYVERRGLMTAEDWRKEAVPFWNDHVMIRRLLAPDERYKFIPGNTTAMHGSFLLIARSNPDHYWYDNYYAIRDIIRDLIAYAIDPFDVHQVKLWKGVE